MNKVSSIFNAKVLFGRELSVANKDSRFLDVALENGQ